MEEHVTQNGTVLEPARNADNSHIVGRGKNTDLGVFDIDSVV